MNFKPKIYIDNINKLINTYVISKLFKMTPVGKRKNLNCTQWTLVIIFVIYWLIFFPVIWFVIQPPPFQRSTSANLLYALLFFVIFVHIYCIVYFCLKRCEQKFLDAQVKEAFAPLEADGERPESIKTAYISREERPNSKRVLIPNVPEAEQNEDAKLYTPGGSNRGSTNTLTSLVNDIADEK